jgi:hypothetical protein
MALPLVQHLPLQSRWRLEFRQKARCLPQPAVVRFHHLQERAKGRRLEAAAAMPTGHTAEVLKGSHSISAQPADQRSAFAVCRVACSSESCHLHPSSPGGGRGGGGAAATEAGSGQHAGEAVGVAEVSWVGPSDGRLTFWRLGKDKGSTVGRGAEGVVADD